MSQQEKVLCSRQLSVNIQRLSPSCLKEQLSKLKDPFRLSQCSNDSGFESNVSLLYSSDNEIDDELPEEFEGAVDIKEESASCLSDQISHATVQSSVTEEQLSPIQKRFLLCKNENVVSRGKVAQKVRICRCTWVFNCRFEYVKIMIYYQLDMHDANIYISREELRQTWTMVVLRKFERYKKPLN